MSTSRQEKSRSVVVSVSVSCVSCRACEVLRVSFLQCWGVDRLLVSQCLAGVSQVCRQTHEQTRVNWKREKERKSKRNESVMELT